MKPSISKLVKNINNRLNKEPIKPVISGPKQRDMRQEAIDIGSHNAKEIFGVPDAGPI